MLNVFRVYCAAVLFFAAALPAAHAETDPTALTLPRNIDMLRRIRVAVSEGLPRILVEFKKPYWVETIQTGQILRQLEADTIEVTSIRNGLRVGRDDLKIYGVKLGSPENIITVQGKTYLDKLQIIRAVDATLTAVNELDVELYLRGVLPKEVMSNWPEEALKAQAVAARTYALFDELKGYDSDFSLLSSVQSQVYGGESVSTRATNRAIRETRGEVLLYEGKIIRAYFHSSCGGHTYRADYVWDVMPHSSLMGVRCDFCKGSPAYRWEARISREDIRRSLTQSDAKLSPILALSPQGRDQNGRARNVFIRHEEGDMLLGGNRFRLAMGPGQIRSMIFEVTPTPIGFQLEGRGFGHGVGLCQWGMKRLAENGKTYREILAFYYPGTDVRKIY